MNFKTKALGLIAAAALSLSLATGVAAQSTTGTVDLDKGVCTFAFTSGAPNFGTWTWNGQLDEYQHTAGSNVAAITGNLYEGSYNGTCGLTATFTPASPFTTANFSYRIPSGSGGFQPVPTNATISGTVPGGSYSGDLQLDSVPDAAPDGTTNVGTITVTINTTN